ncbi:MAG: GNAT family N-acetyltransferase [Rhodobacteraceae bacterium]|nr:GNAT family N-acetyltransferase [Paracoccaceae bacterium]
MKYVLRRGVPDTQRAAAAVLYWEAFERKLGPLLGPPERGRGFLERVINPDFAVVAVAPDGALLGLSGFKTLDGVFVGGGFRDLRTDFGLFGAAWRIPLLALLDRTAVAGQLLMDGICVDARARGQGIGAALIDEIDEVARDLGLSEIRLDVIDTNPRAKQLYERLGFEVTDAQDLGPLGGIFGFRRAETMVRAVAGRDHGAVSRKSP